MFQSMEINKVHWNWTCLVKMYQKRWPTLSRFVKGREIDGVILLRKWAMMEFHSIEWFLGLWCNQETLLLKMGEVVKAYMGCSFKTRTLTLDMNHFVWRWLMLVLTLMEASSSLLSLLLHGWMVNMWYLGNWLRKVKDLRER